MKCLTGTKEFHIDEPTVVTIGKFDGKHRGHQKLLKTMVDIKRAKGLKVAVFTFSKVPAGVLKQENRTVITTNEERENSLAAAGVDYLVEYPFTERIAHMPAEEFVSTVLVKEMNAKAVVAGTDCGFGYQRAGNIELLKKLAPEWGYEVIVIEKEQEDHRDISSTFIREELSKGNIRKANELLGEPYSIHGTVVHGNHIGGSVLGFPTANLIPPPEKHLPLFGVYVSQTVVDGRVYGGVTNIGRKPTVEGEFPVGVETFLFGLDEDIYGKKIEVRLLDFIRPEKKFGSLQELKEQIERDKQTSISILSSEEFDQSSEDKG